jgi:hypothetical protein
MGKWSDADHRWEYEQQGLINATNPEFIDGMSDDRLQSEIKRLEHEKYRLAQWTKYDEDRLCAYKEIEFLRRKLIAARNRIEDDTQTINNLCASRDRTV